MGLARSASEFAAVSISNVIDFEGESAQLERAGIVLKTYSGEPITVLGVFGGTVTLADRSALCCFFVVHRGRSLLERDALQKLEARIDCKGGACAVNMVGEKIQEAFSDLFEERLGRIEGFRREVKVKKDAVPIQRKIRRLPLTLVKVKKDAVAVQQKIRRLPLT